MGAFMGKWKCDGLRELDFIKNNVTLHKKRFTLYACGFLLLIAHSAWLCLDLYEILFFFFKEQFNPL